MSRAHRFTCDGCDHVVFRPAYELPVGWRAVRLDFAGFGYPAAAINGAHDYELCEGCMQHFASICDPLKWPRDHPVKYPPDAAAAPAKLSQAGTVAPPARAA